MQAARLLRASVEESCWRQATPVARCSLARDAGFDAHHHQERPRIDREHARSIRPISACSESIVSVRLIGGAVVSLSIGHRTTGE